MTRARGLDLQNALARYLRRWWPAAESAGAGRKGTDIPGTPGVVWECKTAADFKRDFRPTAWVKQAKGHAAGGEVPVTVYFPARIGAENTASTLAIMPLGELMQLLERAGVTPWKTGRQD